MQSYLANIDISVGIDEGDGGQGAANLHVEEQLPVERVGSENGHSLRPVVGVCRELDTAQHELACVRKVHLGASGQHCQSCGTQ